MIYRLGLVCVCLAMCTACTPSQPNPQVGVSDPSGLNQASLSEPQRVALRVEGMTCPNGCYPSVRSAIAKQKGVLDIELAPQKKDDVIDNPIVYVQYTGTLDLAATFKAIQRAGFEAEKLSN